MTKQFTIAALAAAALAVGGCGKQPGDDDQAAQVTLHEIMKDQIDKHADELWDVSNAAIADDAGIDPALMNDQRWADLARLSGEVEAGARQLAALDPIVVVKPGAKIIDEDVPFGDKAVDVQATIDKDPQGFRDMAITLANHMVELAAAAKARDSATAGRLVNELDGVCESCHLTYWYPHQKALIEKYVNSGVPEANK